MAENWKVTFQSGLNTSGLESDIAKVQSKKIKLNFDADGNITGATKGVKEFDSSLKQVVNTTSKLDTQTGKWVKTNEAVNQNLNKVVDTTKSVTKEHGKLITVTTKTLANGNKLITTTKQYKDAQGALVRETKNVNSATGEVVTSLEKVSASAQRGRTVLQNFGATMLKVFEFQVITRILGTFTQGLETAIEVVKEFDDAELELNKVTNMSATQLDNYTKKLGELGQTVGRTRTEMTSMAAEFAKSGFSEDEAAQLAVLSSQYQNIADSEVEAGDAAAYITSQIKAFNISTSDASQIIDQLNEV